MSRLCDRVSRKFAASNPLLLLPVLSPIEDAAFSRKGLARAASDSVAGNGAGGGSATSGRATPSLRATSCLNRPDSPALPPIQVLRLMPNRAQALTLFALRTAASAGKLARIFARDGIFCDRRRFR